MKKTISFLAISLAIIFLSSCKQQTVMHGFKLIEKRFVKEVNADCYYFEHIKSGARVMKIAAKDPNKTFSIGFKTVPYSDNGIAHIMEHSVLNGSKNFPVKSPFDILSKGSLSTYLNASTYKDKTVFPVASMNEKDYFNLMHIYLDAVFNPLIYTDARILKQEGWHYELQGPNEPIIYKGVVYNEMKGAFSGPTRVLRYQVFKNLFPNSSYGYESGGYPTAIPTITQKEFTEFHERFYHPENSYIYLYGDGNLDKELEFIDANYLSKYDRINSQPVIEDEPAFSETKRIAEYYPVLEGSDTENQTYLDYSFVAGSITDFKLTMALDILSEVLFNQESAPVRLALQKAEIGQDIYINTEYYKQNAFRIIVPNANPGDRDKFYEILMATLNEQISKGIDQEAVMGVLNRIEFQLREGQDAQRGITLIDQSMPDWMFINDPFKGIEYEKPLSELKESIQNGYLESVVKQYIINNPHSLLLSLEPKPGLEKERNHEMEKELEVYKSSLSPDSIESLVKETQVLMAFQNREDSPEALATIPLLDLKDINPTAQFYTALKSEVNGVPLLHYQDFTNGIVYINLYFDARVLPQELIPYASLLSDVLTSLNTKNYTYGDLNKTINLNTGGMWFYVKSLLEDKDDNKVLPEFTVTVKAMKDKTDKMFDLSAEILNQTIYSDTSRLKTVLTRLQSQYDGAVKRDGDTYSTKRLESYFSNKGMFSETTAGLEYYWFLTDLIKNFDARSGFIAKNLQKTAALLFTNKNLMVATTCTKEDLTGITKGIESLANSLPSKEVTYQTWNFKLEKKNEGIITPSKVQFVKKGYDFKKLGFAYDGKMQVMNQILSTDWLHTRIRVMGGAYGGWSSLNQSGTVRLNSYRDPNLKETLENFDGSAAFLENFEADDKTMTRYILGTISNIDGPLTPYDKGEMAFNAYLTHEKSENVQKERDEVLSVKTSDIKSYSKLMQGIIDEKAYCVYGNAEKIMANKKLFKNIVKLER